MVVSCEWKVKTITKINWNFHLKQVHNKYFQLVDIRSKSTAQLLSKPQYLQEITYNYNILFEATSKDTNVNNFILVSLFLTL